MWMYSGANVTARVHPEEVPAKMVAGWLKSTTDSKEIAVVVLLLYTTVLLLLLKDIYFKQYDNLSNQGRDRSKRREY